MGGVTLKAHHAIYKNPHLLHNSIKSDTYYTFVVNCCIDFLVCILYSSQLVCLIVSINSAPLTHERPFYHILCKLYFLVLYYT